ncbi:MAG: carbohydrate-binding domain-containing protein [Oscillospiraceae bacterium]|nr:carbohydrate-binding domain-containing protein [Oscillospiraceae bacterium]
MTISLNGTSASASSDSVQISGSTVTITAAGTYILSGSLDNGSVIVNATKEDKVQLVLNGVDIHSDSFAAIYVAQADKMFITLAEGSVNTLTSGGSFVQIDGNDVDAVIFAKDDITLNGSGKLVISSPAGHGIVGKDEVTITGGTYEISSAKCAIRGNDSIAISDGSFTINAETDGLHAENSDDDTLGNIYIAGGSFTIHAGDDAIHANTLLQIDGGEITVSAAEGLEGTCIQINGGDISISASDDGVNAGKKSSAYTPTFEMNDGTLTVVMGQGDTDGIDSNGNIIVNGGTINITGQSTFDYDGTAQYNGGTIIVNGQQVNSISNQMMGGGMGGNGSMGGGRRR